MVYLDNAATTRPRQDILEHISRVAGEVYANPSSLHAPGALAMRTLEGARAQVADLLGAKSRDCVFTSGGTEANALAILGVARAARGRHIVTTNFEHPAVDANIEALANEGYAITRVAIGKDGRVTADAVLEAVTDDTALVAVMWVNNELGTVQPVETIAAALRARGRAIHLHIDAVQAGAFLGNAARRLSEVRHDGRSTGPRTFSLSLALSGHKLHGPRGSGALWLSPGTRILPLWHGGGHEQGLRSGTENVPACAGLGMACAHLLSQGTKTAARMGELRDRFESEVLATLGVAVQPTIPTSTPRAPHIASLRLPNLPAEPLLHALEARGVIASAGSACASRKRGQSHVLRALGVPERDAVLRFSLGEDTTKEEIERAVTALSEAVDEIAEVAQSKAAGRRKTS